MTQPGGVTRPNRLIQATSPYLQQHAHNPVDWYEWGPEALQRAKAEDKPILVSIGYSSCHWCHVMERESFENNDVASLMNEHLVCIKVDREERPDIDQVYMEAVQAMGLRGGWPLNVFLTPEQKPFYGGTYFESKHWAQLIVQLSQAFRQRRTEINQSADDITRHLNNNDLSRPSQSAGPFEDSHFHTAFGRLQSRFDGQYGGLDRAPKFVMPTIWLWLLRYHYRFKNQSALEMVRVTLRCLVQGGIYDQLGGGFARYSVDARWFAPHFEKMLYDNAQLLSLYAEAYRIFPEPRFESVINETVEWLRREMKHPDGAFYSALDADSEGEEGRFYTWTYDELAGALGDDATFFREHYQATTAGNWEHGRNILCRIGATKEPPTEDERRLEKCRRSLMAIRNTRVRPGLDDKVLTGWNAMLISGLTDAYRSLGRPDLLLEALGIARFLQKHLLDGRRCFRAFKVRRSTTEGFLEDYAHLIHAWIALYECTFDEAWVLEAAAMCEHVVAQFRDPNDGFFFVAPESGEKLIARKKDLFDNVIPSPNSVMARNLYRLGILLDREEWKQDALEMVSKLHDTIISEPVYMSNWGIAAMETSSPFFETVITGPRAGAFREEFSKSYHPFTLLMGTSGSSTLPLVKDRAIKDQTLIHVCVDKTCQLPVKSVPEALLQLTSRPE